MAGSMYPFGSARGGEVHDVGFSLMVLLPLPYVDASASTMFPDKRDRMLVSAAGILVEVAFAGWCLVVGIYPWCTTERWSGLAHTRRVINCCVQRKSFAQI